MNVRRVVLYGRRRTRMALSRAPSVYPCDAGRRGAQEQPSSCQARLPTVLIPALLPSRSSCRPRLSFPLSRPPSSTPWSASTVATPAMQGRRALLLLSLLFGTFLQANAANFTFTFGSPTQCNDFPISWSGACD